MSYELSWRPLAERRLTEIWLSGRDRDQITKAVDDLETVLRRDPLSVGESRDGNQRIVFCGPLVVTFLIDDERQIVHVQSILRIH